jgi:hypothetical protein
VCPYNIKHTLLSVGGKAVSSGTLALSLWPLAGHTGKAHPLKPAHLPLHGQPTSSLDWENKINHQPNRLTGRTGITQLTHSLVQNIIPVRRYKYIRKISDKNMLSAITTKRGKDILSAITDRRYKDRVRSITANRAFDENPMPSRRAFQRMAGLAVLHPSVVDCIGLRVKTL